MHFISPYIERCAGLVERVGRTSILGRVVVRRLLIALAVLIGLTAVAAGVDTRQTAQESSPEATPSRAPGNPRTITRAIEADAPQPSRVHAKLGDTVVLTISSPELDSVELEGIGKIEPIDPESPARIEVYADTVGEYPITLLQAQRRIGTLTIE
jgi:hypothetical protein